MRPLLAAVPLAAAGVVLGVGAAPVSNTASGQEAGAPAPAAPAEAAVARVKPRGAPVALLRARTNLRTAPGGKVVAKLGKRTEWRSRRVLAVVGARGRWLRVVATELPNHRRGWIPLKAARLVANPWAVRVDLSERRVEVLRGGRAVRRFRVTVGKPGTPTPTGRFAVTDKLAITGGSAAYGCCAVALSGKQPHIEPGWRGGDRLAIHGTRLTYTIGQAASFGCLRARDADARWMTRRLYVGTIVEIRS